MDTDRIKTKVEEIQRLKNTVGEPFKKVKIQKLKDELLEILPPGPTIIEGYVLYKTETFKPYLQIYTEESWEISQAYLKEKK